MGYTMASIASHSTDAAFLTKNFGIFQGKLMQQPALYPDYASIRDAAYYCYCIT